MFLMFDVCNIGYIIIKKFAQYGIIIRITNLL